jgi:hypothetical protein
MSNDLALDHETVSAQLEVCPVAPVRVLACGHERATFRDDATFCRACLCVQAVLTPERALREAEVNERAAQLNDDLARRARERAAAFRRFATTTTGERT